MMRTALLSLIWSWLLVLQAQVVLQAHDNIWTPNHYKEKLAELDRVLELGDHRRMGEITQEIADARVSWPGALLPGDPTMVQMAQQHALAAMRLRLKAIHHELQQLSDNKLEQPLVNRFELERLAARERSAGSLLPAGGEVIDNPLDPHYLPPTVSDFVIQCGEWIWDMLKALLEWIRELFRAPDQDKNESGSGVVTMTLIVVGAVIVVAVVLAVLTWKRQTPLLMPTINAEKAEVLDADPRSRGAEEWARYARELVNQGRHREAIRAWYHALLVGCWSYGLLHHRVGRTNWEYALTLSAQLAWRGRFQDLTQRFDQAWYGGRVQSEEASAFASEAEELLQSLHITASEKSAR